MTKEAPNEIVEKALSAVKLAKQNGTVRKGVNEVTKSLERGLATLVLVANDVDPKEVVMHLPGLCEQRKIPLINVPTKIDLGKAAGLNLPCSSVAVEKGGSGENAIKEIREWFAGKPAAPAAHPSASHPSPSEKPAAPASHPSPSEKPEKK